MIAWLVAIALGMALQGGTTYVIAARERVRSALLAAIAELASPVLGYLVLPSLPLPVHGRHVFELGLLATVVIEWLFYVALISALSVWQSLGVAVGGNLLAVWLSSLVPL